MTEERVIAAEQKEGDASETETEIESFGDGFVQNILFYIIVHLQALIYPEIDAFKHVH